MKALCIESDYQQSTINIELEPGIEYNIEEATEGTAAQNKTFHPLCNEYYKSGLHSFVGDLKTFRDYIKKDLGEGFESYVYAIIEAGKPIVVKVDSYEEIPIEVRKDADYKKMIRGKLKSWADYTKKQRRETIDLLISEMLQMGVDTKKFREIMEGLERENR